MESEIEEISLKFFAELDEFYSRYKTLDVSDQELERMIDGTIINSDVTIPDSQVRYIVFKIMDDIQKDKETIVKGKSKSKVTDALVTRVLMTISDLKKEKLPSKSEMKGKVGEFKVLAEKSYAKSIKLPSKSEMKYKERSAKSIIEGIKPIREIVKKFRGIGTCDAITKYGERCINALSYRNTDTGEIIDCTKYCDKNVLSPKMWDTITESIFSRKIVANFGDRRELDIVRVGLTLKMENDEKYENVFWTKITYADNLIDLTINMNGVITERLGLEITEDNIKNLKKIFKNKIKKLKILKRFKITIVVALEDLVSVIPFKFGDLSIGKTDVHLVKTTIRGDPTGGDISESEEEDDEDEGYDDD